MIIKRKWKVGELAKEIESGCNKVNNETTKSFECPICGKNNNCGTHSCWCNKEVFPSGIFDLVPVHQLKKSCICKECLDKFRDHQKEN